MSNYQTNYVVTILICIIFIVGVWGFAKVFADAISDYELVTPETNVKCIIVSRMFNTSVDCWRTD